MPYWVIVRFGDKKTQVVSSNDVENYKPRHQNDFNSSATYRVKWQESTTASFDGYYDASIMCQAVSLQELKEKAAQQGIKKMPANYKCLTESSLKSISQMKAGKELLVKKRRADPSTKAALEFKKQRMLATIEYVEKNPLVPSEEPTLVPSEETALVSSEERALVSSEERALVSSEETDLVSSEERDLVPSRETALTPCEESAQMNDEADENSSICDTIVCLSDNVKDFDSIACLSDNNGDFSDDESEASIAKEFEAIKVRDQKIVQLREEIQDLQKQVSHLKSAVKVSEEIRQENLTELTKLRVIVKNQEGARDKFSEVESFQRRNAELQQLLLKIKSLAEAGEDGVDSTIDATPKFIETSISGRKKPISTPSGPARDILKTTPGLSRPGAAAATVRGLMKKEMSFPISYSPLFNVAESGLDGVDTIDVTPPKVSKNIISGGNKPFSTPTGPPRDLLKSTPGTSRASAAAVSLRGLMKEKSFPMSPCNIAELGLDGVDTIDVTPPKVSENIISGGNKPLSTPTGPPRDLFKSTPGASRAGASVFISYSPPLNIADSVNTKEAAAPPTPPPLAPANANDPSLKRRRESGGKRELLPGSLTKIQISERVLADLKNEKALEVDDKGKSIIGNGVAIKRNLWEKGIQTQAKDTLFVKKLAQAQWGPDGLKLRTVCAPRKKTEVGLVKSLATPEKIEAIVGCYRARLMYRNPAAEDIDTKCEDAATWVAEKMQDEARNRGNKQAQDNGVDGNLQVN